MSTKYNRKDKYEMAFDRARKRIRLATRLAGDEVNNILLAEASEEFNRAKNQHILKELGQDEDEVFERMLESIHKFLDDPSTAARLKAV